MNQNTIHFTLHHLKVLADLATPVGTFLKIREQYAETLLLESSDYNSKDNSLSFICFEPLVGFEVAASGITTYNHITGDKSSPTHNNIVSFIQEYLETIKINNNGFSLESKFSGLFGYSTYDAVQYFENLAFDYEKPGLDIPLLKYNFYRYVIVFDHFSEDLFLIDHTPEGKKSELKRIKMLIERQDCQTHQFRLKGGESSNMDDEEFMQIVSICKDHCQRGDVFQIVPSRRYSQAFTGDEFNVYRALRSINPSPYLFYFDYTSFKIMGSSPEAQLIVEGGTAEIHPIAGTFKRTGNDESDRAAAEALAQDVKENAEHTMLVDLARNDLSKHGHNVVVDKYKEIQYFSHVIHLTSLVKADIDDVSAGIQIFADTFPAGTLTGAPKYKAMQLIDQLEPTKREFYGGAIGMIRLNGDSNHAIIIRSLLSKQKNLHYQAGAGIVIKSEEELELQEVEHKLAALKKALLKAEEI